MEECEAQEMRLTLGNMVRGAIFKPGLGHLEFKLVPLGQSLARTVIPEALPISCPLL